MRASHALEPIGKLGINPAKRHFSVTQGRLAVARYVRGRRVISMTIDAHSGRTRIVAIGLPLPWNFAHRSTRIGFSAAG